MQLRAAFPGPPRVARRPGPFGQGSPVRPMQPSGSAFPGVVQRVHANVTVRRVDAFGPHAIAINAFIESVKVSIDKAYQYILQNPGLGVLAQLDGHTTHWVLTWNTYLHSGTSQLAAAAFGYAIESLVSIKGSPFRVTPPGGYDIVFQAVKGMTRPDIVLTHGGVEVAWFDLTASDSPLHIFTQKVGWSTRTNIAEITYPSTCITTLNSISTSLSTGISVDFDAREIDREIRFQRFHEKQLRQRFKEMGLDLKGQFVGKMPSKREAGGDVACQNWTKKNLKARGPFKGHTLSNEQVTAILYALGLNPGTYGFDNSVSQSVGEYLLRNILNIPQVSAPRETIPFAPPGFGFGPGLMPQLPLSQLSLSPPFPSTSFALVPVHPPPVRFTLPSSDAPSSPFSPFNFGYPGSVFGSGNGFAPQSPHGFSFSSQFGSQSQVHPHSPVNGPPGRRARIGARESDEKRGLGIRKPARYQPSGGDDTLTLYKVLQQMKRQGIEVRRVTRAAIRYREPSTGQMRTLTFARSGLPVSARRRPIWSVHTTGLPQNGGTPQFVPTPLMLPTAPTPFSPQFASIFGNGTGSMGTLSTIEVEMAIVEYSDEEDPGS